MNCITPKKRTDGRSSFLQLVAYISVRDENSPSDEIKKTSTPKQRATTKAKLFNRLIDYIERTSTPQSDVILEELPDGRQRVKCGEVVCETNCFSLETASAEMNFVAGQSTRCEDPVYHFILSWREEDNPRDPDIFECVTHSLEKLGMGGHQYVSAIHRDTDNVHVHVAVNRVNPQTYKAASLWKNYDTLQKCCRELEARYGYTPDNGSWVRNEQNEIVRAPWRYRSGPRGARAREFFSDKESLYHYAVRHTRNELTKAIKTQGNDWRYLHLLLHAKGLGLREQNGGLVVYNYLQPDGPAVKASDVHPTLTKARLESYYGSFEGPPAFETDDPEDGIYGIFETYSPELQVRDKGVRRERREERAEAREALKQRYQRYRNAWQKPDLCVKQRYQDIADRVRTMKQTVRETHTDPLMRKLLYRVAEFERIKAMAALRTELRKERQALYTAGKYRPMPYRAWVEQEALKGDVAAVSQLRGFAYREKRKARERAPDKFVDRVIVCGVADDSPLLDRGTHTSVLRRDGTIEYQRDGVVAVIDRGERIDIQPGFADYPEVDNYRLAADIAATKSGEHVKIVGTDKVVDDLLLESCRFNHQFEYDKFVPTDGYQRGRYQVLEKWHVLPEGHQSTSYRQWDDDEPENNPFLGPAP